MNYLSRCAAFRKSTSPPVAVITAKLKVVCYELYKDSHALSRDQVIGLAGGDISIEFQLPADQRTTTLCYNPPTYWEIEARGRSHAVAYEAYFLVPVYKQP